MTSLNSRVFVGVNMAENKTHPLLRLLIEAQPNGLAILEALSSENKTSIYDFLNVAKSVDDSFSLDGLDGLAVSSLCLGEDLAQQATPMLLSLKDSILEIAVKLCKVLNRFCDEELQRVCQNLLQEDPLVWYCSYGSNLCRDRFMCYIEGGTVEGMDIEQRGARNKDEPLEVINYKIPNYRLFFSGRSHVWGGGGFALIKKCEGHECHSRGYLIRLEQFNDVLSQENSSSRISVSRALLIELALGMFNSYSLGSGAYSCVYCPGIVNGAPVLGFTCPNPSQRSPNLPSIPYATIIVRGLLEMKLSCRDIVDYILDAMESAFDKECEREIVTKIHQDLLNCNNLEEIEVYGIQDQSPLLREFYEIYHHILALCRDFNRIGIQ